MAASPVDPNFSTESESVNLTRVLTRLQEVLLESNSEEEARLRNSRIERYKLRNNISYAQNALIQLEKDALGLAVQSRRQDAQVELLQKHELLERLSEKLQELDGPENVPIEEDKEQDSDEDILGEDTPSESAEDEPSSPDLLTPQEPSPTNSNIPSEPVHKPPTSAMSDYDQLFPSTLRARHAQSQNTSPDIDTATATGSFKPSSTVTESLLTENRTEQEAITTSLLSAAQQLRASILDFSTNLESGKETLERTASGLEKNVSGMESANKRMGFLRKMTEGKGWLGRMQLYAYIFALMVVAVLIVAVMPKLRF